MQRSFSWSFRLLPRGYACMRRRQRGQAVVEFGVVAILFFLTVSGIVDYGRVLTGWIVLSNAAREGARQASVGASPSSVTQATRQFSAVPGLSSASVIVNVHYYSQATGLEISPSQALPGDGVSVAANAPVQIVTALVKPFFGCPTSGTCTRTIGSSTRMRYEGPSI